MAVTEDRLRDSVDVLAPGTLTQEPAPVVQEHARPLTQKPVPVARPAPRAHPILQELPAHWAALLAGAWLVGLTVAVGLEPPPVDPSAAMPLSAALINAAFLATLGVTMGGLAIRRAWAGIGSLAAAGVFAVMVVACPASGHHEYGAWWLGQLAITAGLVTASAATVKRFSPLRRR